MREESVFLFIGFKRVVKNQTQKSRSISSGIFVLLPSGLTKRKAEPGVNEKALGDIILKNLCSEKGAAKEPDSQRKAGVTVRGIPAEIARKAKITGFPAAEQGMQ